MTTRKLRLFGTQYAVYQSGARIESVLNCIPQVIADEQLAHPNGTLWYGYITVSKPYRSRKYTWSYILNLARQHSLCEVVYET